MALPLLSRSKCALFGSGGVRELLPDWPIFSRNPELAGINGKRHSKNEAPTRLETPVALLLVLLPASEAGEEGVSGQALLSSVGVLLSAGTAVEIAIDGTRQFARRAGAEINESSVSKSNASSSKLNVLGAPSSPSPFPLISSP